MLPKLLVIDDEPEVRESLSLYFTHRGFSVEQAGCGISGLEKLHAVSPDVILLDMRMPEFGGLEFLNSMRDSPKKDTAVICVSGCWNAFEEALANGVYDFHLKPFDLKNLHTAILATIERRKNASGQEQKVVLQFLQNLANEVGCELKKMTPD